MLDSAQMWSLKRSYRTVVIVWRNGSQPVPFPVHTYHIERREGRSYLLYTLRMFRYRVDDGSPLRMDHHQTRANKTNLPHRRGLSRSYSDGEDFPSSLQLTVMIVGGEIDQLLPKVCGHRPKQVASYNNARK